MAITVRESNEKDGIKGWTALGVWENAGDGDAFVSGDGCLCVAGVVDDYRRIISFLDDNEKVMVHDKDDFCSTFSHSIFHPVDLDIRWTRK